ncbi:MAG TPA: DUF4150 domain-containing protein [Vicinamibacterales bacterium]|nr:DUF4150 domain-containing protein [Vicinamibacterales bacterium]
MGTNVDANGRSILHKGHGQTHTCAPPDVCKTPSPGGPVPIPYVNIAMDSDITDGADTVKIEGNPVANVAAKISTSSGDEAGSAGGGILSSKIKGTVTWKMGSLDVKAEGKSVVRFLDPDFHNGNSFNSAYKNEGGTGMAYGDDFEGKCPVCDKEPVDHKILENDNSAAICARIIAALSAEFKKLDEEKKILIARKRLKKRQSPTWEGYMVGVMVCKCPEGSNPRTFAAMSGEKPLPKFVEIASKEVDRVIGDGGSGGPPGRLGPGDFITANTSVRAYSGFARLAYVEKLANVVNGAWDKIDNRRRGGGYSPLGVCAGAHLVTKAGHAPAQMTEMFFSPSGFWVPDFKKAGGYRFRLEGVQKVRRFGTNVKKTDETPWGPTVGSCHTCQELLFLAMCPKRVCG